jgi:hypothetical protein
MTKNPMKISAAIVATVVLAWATPVKAGNSGDWRLIGRVQAGHSADHDTLVVQGKHDDFRKLKIKVTDAPVHIERMVVIYDNGEPDRIDVRQEIPQGGESRVLDLKGGKRSLRKIEFWYDTKGLFKGKADVTVFGRK